SVAARRGRSSRPGRKQGAAGVEGPATPAAASDTRCCPDAEGTGAPGVNKPARPIAGTYVAPLSNKSRRALAPPTQKEPPRAHSGGRPQTEPYMYEAALVHAGRVG